MADDPDWESGPRCTEVSFFVAPGNGEHAWQCLDCTCGVTVAFTWVEARMEVIIERCCGLDVHQETVVACVLIGAPGERPRKEIRTFRTMTRDLEALRDWLQELGDPRRHGEHGRLLAPGLRRPRRVFRPHRRQRPAYPQRAGAQDRREGFRVDRRSGSARPDRQELRAAAAAAGTARVVALSPQAGGKPGGRTQPAPEAPGDRQRQARKRRFRRFRRVRPRDA